MAVNQPFEKLYKTDKVTVRATIINFDDQKHPAAYNRMLAEAMVKEYESRQARKSG